MAMTSRTRVLNAIQQKEVDRPPISLWMHHPYADRDPEKLTKALLKFHKDFHCDFLKVMSFGLYSVVDWGCKVSKPPDRYTPSEVTDFAVKKPDDWTNLRYISPSEGEYGKQLQVMRNLRLLVEDPIIPTIFSPLTTAKKLAGDVVLEHMRKYPERLHEGLKIITRTTREFLVSALDAGADGYFFATQCATTDFVTRKEHEDFGATYDLEILRAADERAQLKLLHIHGSNTMFKELVSSYPINMVNWHDRITYPSIKEARKLFNGCLVGGIDENTTLYKGTEAQIRGQILDAVEQNGSTTGLIIAPGCVIPPDTDRERLLVARRTIDVL